MGPLRRSIPALLIVLGTSAPAVVASGVPDPNQATLPSGISLVGDLGGVADPAGYFTVNVRYFSGNPMIGTDLAVEFFNCTTDIGVCAAGAPGNVVECPTQIVHGTTDDFGTAQFTIRGCGRGGVATIAGPCARIYADGVLIGTLPVATYDLDGHGGVGPPDISLWLVDYFRATVEGGSFARSDYDFSGTLTGADLSLLLRVALTRHSLASCTSLCN